MRIAAVAAYKIQEIEPPLGLEGAKDDQIISGGRQAANMPCHIGNVFRLGREDQAAALQIC